MFRKHLMLATAAFGITALALAPSVVQADIATVNVSASVSNSCNFTTTSDSISFGNYTGATITKPYAAKYSCTSGDSTYKFSFKSAKGTGAQCAMSDGGANTLNYSITDSSLATQYGCDGTFFASANGQPAGIGSGILTNTFTFALGPNQTQVVGTYTDTVTVTITP